MHVTAEFNAGHAEDMAEVCCSNTGSCR